MHGEIPHAQEEGFMQVVTETFWEYLNGRIVCENHIGVEASAKLCKGKSPKTITTSMTKWFKMTEQEVSEFSELVGTDHSICESCRSEVK
jgi:hypothetical protein